jgi:hypothetical protein
MQLLAATGQDHVLLAHLDQLAAIADAMRRGRAGRGDGIAEAFDLEGRCDVRGDGRGHAARHHIGADALGPLFARDVRGLDLVRGRRPAGAHDDAGAFVADLAHLQAGILDGLAHGDVAISGAIAHETPRLTVDMLVEIDLDGAVNVAAEP